jgi:hypothetical protein
VGKASTDSVVSCSVLILFADIILTQLLMQCLSLSQYQRISRHRWFSTT